MEPKQRGALYKQAPQAKSKTPLIVGIAAVTLLTIGVAYWLLTQPAPPIDPTTPGNSTVPVGMVSIPAGEFMMGSNVRSDYEKPAHPVKVESFLIDKTEVTNTDYAEFLGQNRGKEPPSHWQDGKFAPGDDRLPVVNVSWYNARDYCEWKAKRLPTEEEWEFAARGKENLLYPYGNQWNQRASNASESQLGKAQAVGGYPDGVSPFSVFDMAGNVAEWTASDYKPYLNSPAKPQLGQKIIRGGSFANPAKEQTATDRFFNLPNRSFDYIGFRCAKNAK